MRWCVLMIFFCLAQTALAQKIRTGTRWNNAESTGAYSEIIDYLPQASSAVLEVPVNLILWTTTTPLPDGSNGNFDPNVPRDMEYLRKAMNSTQRRYERLTDPKKAKCYEPPIDYIADTKIRFDFKVYWIADDTLWDANNCHPRQKDFFCPGSWAKEYRQRVDSQLVANEVRDGIQLFYTNQAQAFDELIIQGAKQDTSYGRGDCSMFPSFTDSALVSYISQPNEYLQYRFYHKIKGNVLEIRTGLSRSMAHEMGHSFNLTHQGDCSENVMWNRGHPKQFNYFKPWQMAVMHHTLRHGHMRRFVTPLSTGRFTITDTAVWNFPATIYETIRIAEGGQLTITDTLKLAAGTKIEVEAGGTLILKGAVLQSNTDENWQGIKLLSAGKRRAKAIGNLRIDSAYLRNTETAVEVKLNHWLGVQVVNMPQIENLKTQEVDKRFSATARIRNAYSYD